MDTKGFWKTGESTLRKLNDTANDTTPNTALRIKPYFSPFICAITIIGNSAIKAISMAPIEIGKNANIKITEVITAMSAISFVLLFFISPYQSVQFGYLVSKLYAQLKIK